MKLMKLTKYQKAKLRKIVTALEMAKEHLEYCGYGRDTWEREIARDAKLPELIDEGLKHGRNLLNHKTINLQKAA